MRMKSYVAAAMAVLIGCGSEPPTKEEPKSDRSQFERITRAIDSVLLRYNSQCAMLDRLERVCEKGQDLFEPYKEAFQALYSKALEKEPRSERLAAANAIADCVIGDETDSQTAYVVYASDFAKSLGIPTAERLKEVENKIRRASNGFGRIREYVTRNVGFTVADESRCQLCGANLSTGIFKVIEDIITLVPTGCPKNYTIIQPPPSTLASPYRQPVRFKFGPHTPGASKTVYRSVDEAVLEDGTRASDSSNPRLSVGTLVIIKDGKLQPFPTTPLARTAQEILNELKSSDSGAR
ncbi:MAG: hypothetical protein QW548_02440 [Candidatus Aenigmatarchaeota archaeon]